MENMDQTPQLWLQGIRGGRNPGEAKGVHRVWDGVGGRGRGTQLGWVVAHGALGWKVMEEGWGGRPHLQGQGCHLGSLGWGWALEEGTSEGWRPAGVDIHRAQRPGAG